jgi:outer membrane protein TolC
MTLRVFVASCLCVAATTAQAQQAANVITLDSAIQQALAASRRLAELQSRTEAAEYAVAGRRAADRPAVSLLGGYTRTNHVDEFSIAFPGRAPVVVYPDIPDNYRTRLDLQWPIYTGGRAGALEAAARAEREATAGDLDAARADLRLEVTRAFWALVTARDTEAVLARSVDVADAHVKDLRARLAQGLISPNDVSSAEAQASHQHVLALEAANQRAVAEADLRRLTANETPGRLEPDVATEMRRETSGPAGDAASKQTAELIAAALTRRAERRSLQQRAASAADRAKAAGAAARPQVSIGGGYDYARPNPRIFPRTPDWRSSWDASVNVSWSLWDGGRRAAEQGEARALAAALATRVEDFDRQLTFEVRARQLDVDSSREAVTAAADEVRAATDAERVVGERYRAGVATSTDVLEAQVARLQAELDRTRAIANLRLAEARLQRALGF